MPIEISELHIKVKVDKAQSIKEDKRNLQADKSFQQLLLAECVEEVMQLLKDKKER